MLELASVCEALDMLPIDIGKPNKWCFIETAEDAFPLFMGLHNVCDREGDMGQPKSRLVMSVDIESGESTNSPPAESTNAFADVAAYVINLSMASSMRGTRIPT